MTDIVDLGQRRRRAQVRERIARADDDLRALAVATALLDRLRALREAGPLDADTCAELRRITDASASEAAALLADALANEGASE